MRSSALRIACPLVISTGSFDSSTVTSAISNGANGGGIMSRATCVAPSTCHQNQIQSEREEGGARGQGRLRQSRGEQEKHPQQQPETKRKAEGRQETGEGQTNGEKGGEGRKGQTRTRTKQRGRGKRQKVNQCRSRATCVAPSRQRRHQESRSAAKQVVSTFLSQDHAACQYTGSQSGSEATHARRTLSCFPTCSLELSSKTGG